MKSPIKFYSRLSRFTMDRILSVRSPDVRSLVMFNKIAIVWDAPDAGRKVKFK